MPPRSTAPTTSPTAQLGRHDHGACVARVLEALDSLQRDGVARVTPVRRRVLEILLESHCALGAYDILKRLAKEGMAAQPPVAYRALDFLTEHGLVHKIERMNAFVACIEPHRKHEAAFLVCRACGTVAEAASRPALRSLGKTAADAGFEIEHAVVEMVGLCRECARHAGQ